MVFKTFAEGKSEQVNMTNSFFADTCTLAEEKKRPPQKKKMKKTTTDGEKMNEIRLR